MLGDVASSVAPQMEKAGTWRLTTTRLPFELLGVLLFTALGFLVMGYHPGLEDDGIYLAAVKADLNPALFPYNANFFRLQMEATLFDGWMAHFVRWTGMPVAWAELFWQLVSLFLILWAVKKIANRLFAEETARWAGVAMVAAMFTLPVSGIALYMTDQHLHPRNLAGGAVASGCLFAASADGRVWHFVLLFSDHSIAGLRAYMGPRIAEFDGSIHALGLGLRARRSRMAQGAEHANLL